MAEKTKFQSTIQTTATVVQAIAVVLGIGFTVHELVIKDRAAVHQRTELTLTYAQKIRDDSVAKAFKKLLTLRDAAYGTPVGVPTEDAELTRIVEDFDRNTRDVALYYDVLNRGIDAHYFDAHLAQLLLQAEARETLDVISDLQGRIGSKNFTPSRFRSVAQFYSSCPGAEPVKIVFDLP
jgi:hypothetical protein